jgi:PAS domain S-box-containing protein
VLAVNPSFERSLGYSLHDFESLSLDCVLPPPADAPKLQAVLRKLLRRPSFHGQARAIRKDGSTVEMAFVATPFRARERSGVVFVLADRQAQAAVDLHRQRFLEDLFARHEQERQRLAQELHDETGQSFAALTVGLLNLLDEIEDTNSRARVTALLLQIFEAMEGVRRMAQGLRPAVLDDRGLKAAFEALAREFEHRFGIDVDLHVAGLDDDRLGDETETALFRILQEALTNVGRHSGATTVSVILERGSGQLRLIVEDNGRGLPGGTPEACGECEGFGLRGMRERALLLGGSLVVESLPGSGTTLYVEVPVETVH